MGFRTDFATTEARLEYLEEGLKDHIGYVEFLLCTYNLWSLDGTFTFPNGETFYKVNLRIFPLGGQGGKW